MEANVERENLLIVLERGWTVKFAIALYGEDSTAEGGGGDE
jgi:hypothetical protein